MKKILIIAYYFPPSNASGVFRTLGFVKHLSRMGWDISVLTMRNSKQPTTNNYELDKFLPSDIKVIAANELNLFSFWEKFKKHNNSKSPGKGVQPVVSENNCNFLRRTWNYVKNQLTGFLKVPDSQLGWLLPAIGQLRHLNKADIIYSSGPPFTGHLIGAILKRKWNVPLITDFRDPWGGNPFRISHGGLVERYDRQLEKMIFKYSDRIIANTIPMADLFKNQFPFASRKISVITNGFDKEDFDGIEAIREVSEDKMLMVHPGLLYGQRNPLQFLYALQEAIVKKHMVNILVYLIGRNELIEGETLETHIDRLGIGDNIKLFPPMPHNKVLSIMAGADCLLLLAQGTTLQVPAKLFEYMGVGKPIFAVCEEGSATLQIMAQLGERHFYMSNSKDEILNCLGSIYEMWQKQNFVQCADVDNPFLPFYRNKLATDLDRILRDVLPTLGSVDKI